MIYRVDIYSPRALAVLSVLLFQVGTPSISGGFRRVVAPFGLQPEPHQASR